MPESVGSKIDLLIVTNQRLWDAIQWQLDLKEPENLGSKEETFDRIKKVTDLNKLRNTLVKEIDACLHNSGMR